MKTQLILILIGHLQVTSYRSVPAQTDSTPFHTSTGEKVSPDGVAVAQNLLCGACRKLHRRCKEPSYTKKLHYGDWLWVEDVGPKRVNDVMHKRLRDRIDVWVATKKQEQAFDRKYKRLKLNVFKIKGEIK